MGDQILPRVLLATIGVGVPLDDIPLLADAIAAEAGRLGYTELVVEDGQVSGARDDLGSKLTRDTCPECLRKVARYHTGRFYEHHCEPMRGVS